MVRLRMTVRGLSHPSHGSLSFQSKSKFLSVAEDGFGFCSVVLYDLTFVPFSFFLTLKSVVVGISMILSTPTNS